jgi:hypothetical protein
MQARNDATVSGADLSAALGRILPRGKLRPTGRIIITAAANGMLRFKIAAPEEQLPATGIWSDSAEVSPFFYATSSARNRQLRCALYFMTERCC